MPRPRYPLFLSFWVLACSAFGQQLKFENDYILPGDLGARAKEAGTILAVGPVSDVDSSQVVQYRSFSGPTYTLVRYTGRHCAILLPDAWDKIFTVAEKRRYLDQLDFFYEHFKEVVGGEPTGTGLLDIAHIPLPPGIGGYGRVGIKGIELLEAQFHIDAIKADAVFNSLHDGAVHEMAHNFDLYSQYLHYTGDAVHAWVVAIETWVGAYSGIKFRRWRTVEEWDIGQYHLLMDGYLKFPSGTWDQCVRVDGCPNILGNQTWGGFQRLIAQLYGPESIKKAMRFIRSRTNRPAPQSAQAKADLHVEALASGANADLSCIVDAVRMYASPALRTAMGGQYGANSICQDRDGDGFSAVFGDLNDSNNKIFPGAVEVQNGIDDDCDGVVDNLVVEEGVGRDFPAGIELSPGTAARGEITAVDSDRFTLKLTETKLVQFKLSSRGAFKGWVFLYEQSGAWRSYCYSGAGSSCDFTSTLPPGTWRFDVTLNSESVPGPYAVQIHETVPGPTGIRVRPAEPAGAAYRLSAEFTAPILKRTPTEVRFWITGIGFVGSRPYGSLATLDWTPPADLTPGVYGYRVQAFTADIPVSVPTIPEFFGVGAGAPPVISAASSLVTLSYAQGGTSPLPSARVALAGSGGFTLAYTVSSAPSWLTVSPLNGTSRDELVVSANVEVEKLIAGVYLGAIELSVPTSAQRFLSIPVKLAVTRLVPAITAVLDAWSYRPGIASGAWITIVGKNLASRGQTWNISGPSLPTSLEGVTVRFNGLPGPVLYVSPEQINVLVPGLWGAGPMSVTVETPWGLSPVFPITATTLLPAFYTVSPAGSTQRFVTAALAGTGILIGNRQVDTRVLRGAKAGDLLDLYVIGAGPTAAGFPFITDRVFSAASPIRASTRATLGGEPMEVLFAGLTSPGLYLVRVRIPDGIVPGSPQLVLSFDGIESVPGTLVVDP